jgi:homoserine/homoserine lactone efflux protein
MTLQTLLVFAAMEFVFSVTPGPAVLLVSAYGFRRGWPAAMAAVLGIETGNTIYLAISAMGLGALLVASSLAFAVVKWAGAIYLVCLGAWTIWKAGTQSATPEPKLGTFSHPYVQALLTQLGNPKAVLFFGALIPQFLDARMPLLPQYAEMWAIIAVGETTIVGGYGWLAAQGKRAVSPAFAIWRERVSGACLIFIGAIFATVRRAT